MHRVAGKRVAPSPSPSFSSPPAQTVPTWRVPLSTCTSALKPPHPCPVSVGPRKAGTTGSRGSSSGPAHRRGFCPPWSGVGGGEGVRGTCGLSDTELWAAPLSATTSSGRSVGRRVQARRPGGDVHTRARIPDRTCDHTDSVPFLLLCLVTLFHNFFFGYNFKLTEKLQA